MHWIGHHMSNCSLLSDALGSQLTTPAVHCNTPGMPPLLHRPKQCPRHTSCRACKPITPPLVATLCPPPPPPRRPPHTTLQLQVWKATVYLTPLLGAYLADAVMGRFWVILVFSCIYFLVRPAAHC